MMILFSINKQFWMHFKILITVSIKKIYFQIAPQKYKVAHQQINTVNFYHRIVLV